MGKCINCNRRGIFLKTKRGLCESCTIIIEQEAKNTLRILNDCDRIVKSTKSIETAVKRCNLAIDKLDYLAKYEKLGFEILSEPCDGISQQFKEDKNNKILEITTTKFDDILNDQNSSKAKTRKLQLAKQIDNSVLDFDKSVSNYHSCNKSLTSMRKRLLANPHTDN